MGKQIFILSSSEGNAGVAKVIKNGKRYVLSVHLENNLSARKKFYISCDGVIKELGYISKNHANFDILEDAVIDGVFITGEKTKEPEIWSGEKPYKTEDSSLETVQEPKQLPDFFTFENFFGGGFEWNRIRGNFIMYDYSIIHHILSAKNVYPAINRAGYYCAGIRDENDLKLIAIAIPIIKGKESPFSSFSADVYKIKSGKISFDTLCVGIDKTGEFFVSI